MSAHRRLERAVREHREAVERYVATAETLDASAWVTPWAEGKWSPAEVTEHLVLYYEAALDELSGTTGMKVKVGPVTTRLLRWFLLPHIIFHRTVPLRARAPRAIRPTGSNLDRVESLLRIRESTDRFESEIGSAAAGRVRTVTHPYFGTLRPAVFVRFSAVHLEHHHRQIRRVPAGRAEVEPT
ncbi:MAG: DinB family protein [Gemmatimonadota bacterium]